MSNRWAKGAQRFLMSAWLIAGCADTGGPAPEVPAPFAGNGAGGMSGAGGSSGAGGHAGVQETGGAGGMLAAGAGGAGGAGAFGGMGGVGGMAGTSGMGGTGGAAGAGVVTCTDGDATQDQLGLDNGFDNHQVLVRSTATGTNGTFEDACTDDGDLIEQVCETQLTCGFGAGNADGACAPSPQSTGRVVELRIACVGLCQDGACEVPCPEAGDELTVAAVEGDRVQLDSASTGMRYECTRALCLAFAPEPNDALAVVSAPAFDQGQLDCRTPYGTSVAPLELNDGCGYTSCVAIGPAAP